MAATRQPLTIHAVGRRKSSVARVYLRHGTGASAGSFLINHRAPEVYFDTETHLKQIFAPLVLTDKRETFDIKINVYGGGKSGQSGAIVLGLARALLSYDEGLHSALKGAKFLTRDSRRVERKKYGQKGARKKFQFSKR